MEEETPNFEDWLTVELFNYCQSLYIIDPEDIFENWMNARTDLLKICKESLNN
jgi:hypothetical protein